MLQRIRIFLSVQGTGKVFKLGVGDRFAVAGQTHKAGGEASDGYMAWGVEMRKESVPDLIG
jgi:hypothetical protein